MYLYCMRYSCAYEQPVYSSCICDDYILLEMLQLTSGSAIGWEILFLEKEARNNGDISCGGAVTKRKCQ